MRGWLAVFVVCAAACVQAAPQETLLQYTADGQRIVHPEPSASGAAFEQEVVRRIGQIKTDANRDSREEHAWRLAQLISRERVKDCGKPAWRGIERAFHDYETYRNPDNAFERFRREDIEPSMILVAALLGDGNSWSDLLFYPPADPPRANASFSVTEASCIAYEAGGGRPMDWAFPGLCGPRERAARLRQRAGEAFAFCPDTALGRWSAGRRTVTDVIRDALKAYADVESGRAQPGVAYARWGADGVHVQTIADIAGPQDISIARWFDCDQPVDPEAVDGLIARMRVQPRDQFTPLMLAPLGPHARKAVALLIENLGNAPAPPLFLSGPGPYDVEGQCAALEAITQRPAVESSKRCEGYRDLPGFDGADPESIPRVGWVCPDARLGRRSDADVRTVP